MNEDEIDYVLGRCDATAHIFIGTFPIDRLPTKPKLPYAIVVNYDEARNKGSHWVCIYADDNETHFHDSFGLPPLRHQIVDFISPDNYTCSIKQLQYKRSRSCGHHVISYIVNRARGVSSESYLNYFGDDKRHNDVIVRRFVQKLTRDAAGK